MFSLHKSYVNLGLEPILPQGVIWTNLVEALNIPNILFSEKIFYMFSLYKSM